MLIDTFRYLWGNVYLRAIALILGAALLGYLLWQTRSIWASFLVAYTLAYLFQPTVRRLASLGVPRWLGTTATLLFLIGAIGGVGWVVSDVINRAGLFVRDLDLAYWAGVVEGLPRRALALLPLDLRIVVLENPDTLQDVLDEARRAVVRWLELNSGSMLRRVPGFFGGAFQAFIALVMSAYLLYAFDRFSTGFLELFPPRHQPEIRTLSRHLDRVIGGYLRGQLAIALFVGVSVWLVLLVLRIPLAGPLGLLAGIANLVPFLGPIVAGIPAVALGFAKGWGFALAVAIALVVINLLDGNVISPWIFSRTTRIHPVTVIVAIAIGLTLLGVWGALLAVPTAAFLRLLYLEYYRTSRWYLGETRGET